VTGRARDLDAFKRQLAGRRLAERLTHLAAYVDEPPERSLALGVELSEAAHRARRKGA
jgi:hypothetical protein